MNKNITVQPAAKVTPIFAAGHVVGEVRNGVFYKRIKSKHMLNRPRAIAFDDSSLDDAEKAGAASACITNGDTGEVFRADIATIRQHGFPVNRGYGTQTGLELKWWNGRNAAPYQHKAPAPLRPDSGHIIFAAEAEPLQLSLLAEVDA